MRTLAAALCLVAGCASSEPPVRSAADETPSETPEQAEARSRRDAWTRILSEEPQSPYEVVRREAFRAPDQCGQGPYRVSIAALGRRFGEDYSVYACSPRALAGDTRSDGDLAWLRAESQAWGERQDNERCVANEAERTQASAAPTTEASPTSANPARRPRESRAGRAAPAAPPAAPALESVEIAHEGVCPEGLRRIDVVYRRGFIDSVQAPLAAGTRVVVEVWSTLPNDLEGVLFVVEQRGVLLSTTPESWAAYRAARDEWYARYRAFVEEEVAASRTRYVDRTAGSADPPPAARNEARPPSPSEHAEWVPGYWHRGEEWVWMAGFWRVPEADVSAGLTVHAPVAPPAPRAEPRAEHPKPTPDAVWTAGHWQWDGRQYVWVDGAWRIPPSEGHAWQTPSWRVEGRGAVFVPGGWTRGLRR